jgi:PPP family 3-phenylpropionic acid transporter
MLVAGWLYARVGNGAFLAMAGLCAVAIPVAWRWRAGR